MNIESIRTFFNKKDFLIFITLVLAVSFLQAFIFSDQLKYGFRDGDWWILAEYKKLGNFSLNHFIETWKHHGVYTYQVYYIGFAEYIVGLDFKKLHLVTHVFKFLATLGIFFLILTFTKNRLVAFLTTLIYAAAYPTAGAMFMVVTGGYFLAIMTMSVFLICFIFTYRRQSQEWWLYILTSGLFLLTLLLNTERMYALVPLVLLVEFFWLWRKNFSRKYLINGLLRMSILLLPALFLYGIYAFFSKESAVQSRFVEGFLPQISFRTNAILDGNWQLLLYPFASFGSLFLFGDWWKLFGHFNISSLTDFIFYFLSGPMLIFSVTTTIIMRLVCIKPMKLILINIICVAIFGFVVFITANNWNGINQNVRIHYDNDVIGIPALFGFYILVLSFSIFLIWFRRKDGEKKDLLLPLFSGSFISFLFIFLTWIVSDVQLLFMGPQRYLTTPAIGSSLFLASLIVLVFERLREIKLLRKAAWIAFSAIVPIILINANVARTFFNYELNFAGMNGLEQTRMKNRFWSLVPSINTLEQSLFYFDETADYENGYFDESTILAGFDDWIRFDHGKDLIFNRSKVHMIRTNVHCPKITHQSCLKILSEGFTVRNGVSGIWYKDSFNSQKEPIFYKLSNFYALRFINKDIVDIKDEVVSSFKTNE